MSEDYFDVAWVGFDKAILFGTRADGVDFDRVLTDDERAKVERLDAKHQAAWYRLLREMAGEAK